MRFFHGSEYEFKVGRVLVAKKNQGFYDYKAEQIMEMYRPRNQVSRLQAIFMVQFSTHVSMAGGNDDFVYEVEPLERVTKADHGWMFQLWSTWYGHILDKKRINPKDEVYRTLADKYWSSARNSDHHQWEYLSRRVKITDAKYKRRF